MQLHQTAFRFFLGSIFSLFAIIGCKPPEDGKTSENYLKDPSGVILPIPVKQPGSPEAKNVVLFLRNGSDPHQRVQAFELAQRVRATSGYILSVQDAGGSHTEQSDQIRQAVGSKLHAAIVLPVDPTVILPDLSRLKEAGTFLIGFSKELVAGSCDSIIFSDGKKIGSEAGSLIVSALQRRSKDLQQDPVQGRVIEIRSDDTSASSQARHQGLMAALSKERGVVLVHDATANGSPTLAATVLDEAYRLQKQIDAVYVHNDYMARGVHEAALKAGLRENLFIVGTDGTGGPGGGIEMIYQNQLDATIHQPLLVDLAWQIIEKIASDSSFKPKSSYEVFPLAITPKNLEEAQSRGAPTPEP